MITGRKTIFWMSGILGGVLILLFAFLLAAPRLINLKSIHDDIEARIHQETGGQGTFEKLDLFLLPRPHAVIRKVHFSFSEGERLAFKTITVYPRLLPLFKGEFLPAHIQFSSPTADMELTSDKEENPSKIPFPVKNGPCEIPKALRAWLEKTGGLTIEIDNGFLNLTTRGRQALELSDINLSAEHEKGVLTFELNSTSNLFKSMKLKGRIEPVSLKTKGTLKISGFKTGQLPNKNQSPETLRLVDGVIGLQANFEGSSFQSLKANVNLSAPSLGLTRNRRSITVKDARIQGNIQVGKASLVASLSDMTLGYPPMKLSGEFKYERETPLASVRLTGQDVSVQPLRSCALGLADDISAVENIFAIIRDGNVPSISVDAKGTSLSDLANLSGYTIKGQMREGKISLTDPNLNLANVNGTALISNGILSGQRLQANLGDTKGREGILTVALENGAAPFQLNILLDANLAEAHTTLKALVTEGAFAEGLNRIRSIEGQATAWLKLDESKEGLLVDVACSSCRLKAFYRSLPLPITVKNGRVHYRQNHIQLRDLTGAYGQSEFLVASGSLDWKGEPQIVINAAKGAVSLEEIYSLIPVMAAPDKWLKDLKSLKGRLSIDSLNMKGPLKSPASWQYQTNLEVENLFLNARFLPGPLSASKARITAGTKGIRFDDAEIQILDSDFTLTGKSAGPVNHPKRFETSLSGTLGSLGIQYLYNTLELPSDFLVRAPLMVRSGRYLWEKENGVAFKGDLLFPEGPSVSLNFSHGPGRLNIRNLVVKEGNTSATFGMLAHQELWDLNFSGKFRKSSLDKIFIKNLFLDGFIEGNISARILPAQSFSTSAEGFLEGKDIPVYGLRVPAKIEGFSLRAEGQQLRADSVRMILNQNRLVMSGYADLSTEDPRFDVDISTENVDLDKILAFLKKFDDAARNRRKKEHWHFPVRGTAHLMWDSLKLGGFTWRPFQGEVTIEPESIRVAVENARLCGIDSPGFLRIKPGGVELDFQLSADKRNLNHCISCLTHERVSAEGTFDLTGKINGKGNWDNLFEKLEGPILFDSANGKVKQDPALARVLTVLNVTDIFKGRLPTLEKDGLPYDLLQMKATLKNGKIHIRKGLMSSPSMNLVFNGDVDLLNEQLNLNMLASPFTLTDRLIKMIPVAGYILGGTLLSVPVEVDGAMKDPKVNILPFKEIGSGVWKMMKRTLETPVKIVEPMFGGQTKTQDKEDESTFW
ncbi:MAG: AsmA-like C-terminal domain-containing protein [Deltaproteobacteria bacterium]|nr:AsmA-like C-terminal domain-containing protein [Deltaproteobacteria bacterium]